MNRGPRSAQRRSAGFTLAELLIGAAMLLIAVTALLGAFFGQTALNEHARNLTWSLNDATRVMERLRERNTGCATQPSAVPPNGFTSWDAWLADVSNAGGGGKSVQPTPNSNERVFVTCRDNATLALCGDVDQVGTTEWNRQAGVNTNFDPIQITVAVCWRDRTRVIGECAWDGAAQRLNPNDGNGNGVIESPGMLTTIMTCRT